MGLSAVSKDISRRMTPGIPNPGSLLRYDKDGLPAGFNRKGKAVLAGILGAGSAYSAISQYETSHLGTMDNSLHTATPDYSSYAKAKAQKTNYTPAPAGADGSLVFALDRTKNGGFL